jgi:hypothetical protein
MSKKIFIIEFQFLEAGSRHLSQLELHLFRSCTYFTTLGDVLHTTPSGLHHLIMSTAAFIDVSIAKPHRYVVANLSNLKAPEQAVAAMFGDKKFFAHAENRSRSESKDTPQWPPPA